MPFTTSREPPKGNSHLRLVLREILASELLLGEFLLESCSSNLLPECHSAAPLQRIVKSLPSRDWNCQKVLYTLSRSLDSRASHNPSSRDDTRRRDFYNKNVKRAAVTSAGRTRVQYIRGLMFADSPKGVGVVAWGDCPMHS